MMTRALACLALMLLPLPATAQELPRDAIAAQNLAIATSVQDQLMACWALPPGYEGRRISVRLAFWGDGSLDGDPSIHPESLRLAGKYPQLMRSIGLAVERCVPFAGLEALGAEPGERFDITVHFQS